MIDDLSSWLLGNAAQTAQILAYRVRTHKR